MAILLGSFLSAIVGYMILKNARGLTKKENGAGIISEIIRDEKCKE